jgi:hypothetical protein
VLLRLLLLVVAAAAAAAGPTRAPPDLESLEISDEYHLQRSVVVYQE